MNVFVVIVIYLITTFLIGYLMYRFFSPKNNERDSP